MQTTLMIQEISKLSILFTMFCFFFLIVSRKMVIPKYVDLTLGITILCGTGLLLSKTYSVNFAGLMYQLCIAALVGSYTLNKYICAKRKCRLLKRLKHKHNN